MKFKDKPRQFFMDDFFWHKLKAHAKSLHMSTRSFIRKTLEDIVMEANAKNDEAQQVRQ